MGMDICGWVEVAWDGTGKDENTWLTLLRLDTFIDGTDEITEILFGHSTKAAKLKKEIRRAIAKDRGLPKNLSDTVKEDFKKCKELEKKHPGTFFGFTYITLDELNKVNWKKFGINLKEKEKAEMIGKVVYKYNDWLVLIDLLNKLNKSFDYRVRFKNSQAMRLVVWFAW